MLTLGIHTHLDHPRIRYTLDFLRQHPLTQQADVQIFLNNAPLTNDLNISYGTTTESVDFVIPAQGVFFVEKIAGGPFYANRYTSPAETVYSIETRPSPSNRPLLMDRVFQFDLLETIFFHVSRYEEVFAAKHKLDEVGWLKETDHFLVRNHLEKQAVVDRLIAIFLELLLKKPIQQKTTYDLSHDIDVILRFPNFYKFLRSIASSIYRRQEFSYLTSSIANYIQLTLGNEKDPFDCYSWLFSEQNNWTQKTLFLMTGGETRYDNFYKISHPKVSAIIDQARKSGYALGIHPSYNAAIKDSLFLKEKQKLEDKVGFSVRKNRQHWLRFDWNTTPYFYQKNSITEDASLGYRRRLGFRCGTGFPYHLYDFPHEKSFQWIERPLVFMESSAIHEAQRTGIPLLRLMSSFIDENRLNSHISFNFHNSSFDLASKNGIILKNFYFNWILKLHD